jgi:catalase
MPFFSFDAAQLTALQAAMGGAGAVNFVIGPNKGPIMANDGTKTTAQFGFTMTRSVMFDAIVIVGGKSSIDAMSKVGAAKAFILEAYKHCKPIAAINEAVDMVQKLFMTQMINVKLAGESSGVVSDMGVVTIQNFAESALAMNKEGPVTFGTALFNAVAAHRHFERDTSNVAA